MARSLAIATGLGVPASASCAAGIEYQGRFYRASSAELPVAQGRSLVVDPALVLVGLEQGTGRLVVYGTSEADPDDYFRFSKGTWHIR